MKKFALLDSEGFVNFVAQTPKPIANPKAIDCTGTSVDVGWFWNGNSFEEPPKVDPRKNSELSRMDFMLRLDDLGLIDQVEQTVASGGVTRRAKIMWDNAASFHRQNADLIQWANDLGFSENQLDQIFGID